MHKIFTGFLLFFIAFGFLESCARSSRPADSTHKHKVEYGIASFYANKFNGRKTANGEVFSQKKLTAAHNKLPFGTMIKVTNLRNNKSVIVKVNDRLHERNKRVVDLSFAAAKKIGSVEAGIVRVKVEVVD
jgi:rare lipoprotein A